MKLSDDPWPGLEPISAHTNMVRFDRNIGLDDRPTPPDDAYAGDVEPTHIDVEWPSPYDMFDEAALPPRQWVYGQHYLRQFVSVLASAGGIGKTSRQIVEALAICTGRPLLGEVVHEQCCVWIINLEDPMEEMRRRVLAAMRFYQIAPDDVRGRLFLDAGREFRLKFATQTRNGTIPNTALIQHLITKIPERNIGAVFIDPFVSAHDVNENDNGAINAVMAEVRNVADATRCAIGLVHHIRKGNGEDANIDSVRGAGSLIGAARAARVINRMGQDEAARLGIDEAEARSIFRVDDGKANLAPPADKSVWRKMQGIRIGNGEWVGVATEYALPDAFDGISATDARQVRLAVQACQQAPRENPQSKQWVGHIVADILGLDMSEKSEKGRVISTVKTWIKSGILAVETVNSLRDGRDVKVVLAGEVVPGEVFE